MIDIKPGDVYMVQPINRLGPVLDSCALWSVSSKDMATEIGDCYRVGQVMPNMPFLVIGAFSDNTDGIDVLMVVLSPSGPTVGWLDVSPNGPTLLHVAGRT